MGSVAHVLWNRPQPLKTNADRMHQEKTFARAKRDKSVFSSRCRIIGKFRFSSQTTGETQANHLQHPELVRMTDGGIKERGGDVGERAAQPPQLLVKTREEG